MMKGRIIHQVTQGTPEWLALRKGKFTASELGPFLLGINKANVAARYKLICLKLSDLNSLEEIDRKPRGRERIEIMRGHKYEPEAREKFTDLTGMDVEQVGFVEGADVGCSPDGLLCDRTMGLEIKCPMPETHVRYLLDGRLPAAYEWQVHGSMAISGLSQWYFMSYCPHFPPLIIKVEFSTFTRKVIGGLKTIVKEYKYERDKLARIWDEITTKYDHDKGK